MDRQSLSSDAEKLAYLPRVASGKSIAAFALSDPNAGSDVSAMTCAAQHHGDHYVLNREKTWISNGGIADFYEVFACSGEAQERAEFQRLLWMPTPLVLKFRIAFR